LQFAHYQRFYCQDVLGWVWVVTLVATDKQAALMALIVGQRVAAIIMVVLMALETALVVSAVVTA